MYIIIFFLILQFLPYFFCYLFFHSTRFLPNVNRYSFRISASFPCNFPCFLLPFYLTVILQQVT
ncbi:hypothetical protein RUMLAC_01902 [[Ruminococcus] lactaris ATCC 29176]|uniref:Uncharacterized protein n=1 Tax=[Ruminococcus] lactaris ATCC 29176 TaxID=471875 RepID=B5CR02_9FIRM|nr:hypothetical protein RUMLAC_01902 [[Ruminococcus] lactaris ATCC 29176]